MARHRAARYRHVCAVVRRELQQRSNGMDHVDHRRLPGELQSFWKTTVGMGMSGMSQWPYGPWPTWGGRTCIMGGDRQDQGQSCRSCSFPARTMAPSRQGRDAHVGCGAPGRPQKVPLKPISATPIWRHMPFVTRYPRLYLGRPAPFYAAAGRKLGLDHYCGTVAS